MEGHHLGPQARARVPALRGRRRTPVEARQRRHDAGAPDAIAATSRSISATRSAMRCGSAARASAHASTDVAPRPIRCQAPASTARRESHVHHRPAHTTPAPGRGLRQPVHGARDDQPWPQGRAEAAHPDPAALTGPPRRLPARPLDWITPRGAAPSRPAVRGRSARAACGHAATRRPGGVLGEQLRVVVDDAGGLPGRG